ncbi:hemerythrin domain-containing protein [Castellaniella sp.]|uniref:hemerythrin domain-containing protein n=1 Tax=Castellaniella sp. TaxID=1955812 RepID=UPI0035605E1A
MATYSSLTIIRNEHKSLSVMLRSALMLVQQGPGHDAEAFFRSLRAMLLYIDEFPERLHHPKETQLLFPRIVRAVPDASAIVMRLDHDHEFTEKVVPQLLIELVAWEMIGASRQGTFVRSFERYVRLYLTHMQQEEDEILPLAERHFTQDDWKELDAAFEANQDTMTRAEAPTQEYEQLFAQILRMTPAPFGLG